MQHLFTSTISLQILLLTFLAILFLQSGIDKIFNYNDNFNFFKSHFEKSVLKGTVGMLMPVITVLEVGAGLISAIGIFQIFLNGNTQLGLIGAQLSAVAIISLFFGQRVAKDYEGAATLVGYFLVSAACIYIMG